MRLYKVLGPSGESISGGSLSWSLPLNGCLGKWETSFFLPEMCVSGLHLTTNPKNWIQNKSRIFEAEGKEFILSSNGEVKPTHDKVVCRYARLIRELTDEECASFGLFRFGKHSIINDRCVVSGNATVAASGSSIVKAYDSSNVMSFNSSFVRASNEAKVSAYGNSRVQARNSSKVKSYGQSFVRAFDNSSVEAHSNSQVVLFGKASVKRSIHFL